MKSFVTPAAVVSGAGIGSIAGPGGAVLGSGIGYAIGEVYTLKDENKQLVTAITTGDVLYGRWSSITFDGAAKAVLYNA